MNFDQAFEAFMQRAQNLIDVDYARNYPKVEVPKLTTMIGKKYIRVVRKSGPSRSAHCFVNCGTGDVLKAASWKTPAKGIRGNIYTEKHGVTSMGAVYHR